MHLPPPYLSFVLSAALAATTSAALAQCSASYMPGLGIPGADNRVDALATWDPDGAGPATPVVVLGGDFLFAGTTPANRVVAWQPQSSRYENLDLLGAFGGLGGRVLSLLAPPNGDLIAGGFFPGGITRFDGFGWQTLAAGLDGEVHAIAALPNGDLIAGGNFTTAYGQGSVSRVARWNGTTWQPLGAGTDGRVRAIAVLPNGDVVVGGDFSNAGGVPCRRVARWDGTSWSPLGLGMTGQPSTSDSVYALATLPNGDLVAGGAFTLAGGVAANRLARWDGTAWSSLTSGSGADNLVLALGVEANGDLLVGGSFLQIDGVAAVRVARWNGVTWSSLGGGANGPVQAFTTLANGDVFVGGAMQDVGGVPVRNFAKWSGGVWSALGSGTDDWLQVLRTTANGDLVAGGLFRRIDGVLAEHIARRIAGVWTPLGSGVASASTTSPAAVYAIAELPNGDLVAGGSFTVAGGVAASNLARWNGTTWAPLGAGTDAAVSSLLVLPNGDVVAGGFFTTAGGIAAPRIARWDGTAWHGLGSGMVAPWFGGVDELALLQNGDVVAGGVFTAAGGVATDNLARWDGTQWHAFGAPMSPSASIGALAVASNGDLLAGGTFTSIGGVAANFVARWNGTVWAPIGALQSSPNTTVWTLAELPGGDVVAGGSLLKAANVTAGLMRFDGTGWLPNWSPSGFVGTLAWTADGDLAVGGAITTASAAAYFALLRTPCRAQALPFGAGCAGSGGANGLVAATLPWTGTTFRARASGLAPNSLAIGVRGLGTGSLPLSPLLPQALPGCNLLVSPDLLDLHLPNATAPGLADITFPIPQSAALTGGVLHLQVVPVVLSAVGAITEFSATNALTLTIGTW